MICNHKPVVFVGQDLLDCCGLGCDGCKALIAVVHILLGKVVIYTHTLLKESYSLSYTIKAFILTF